MPYLLTFVGFAALIILHEAGHFAAAKAVGMRVERFSLFFGKMLVSFRRGETEYGVGWIPAGGYVKITGMNPHEELSPEIERRAYYNQKVWKRVVVIIAGPFVNLVIAFAILLAIYTQVMVAVQHHGQPVGVVANTKLRQPAADYLRPDDQIVAVDRRGNLSFSQIENRISSHRCPVISSQGCKSATPVRLTIRRAGQLHTFSLYPHYDSHLRRMLIGFQFSVLTKTVPVGLDRAARQSVNEMWTVTSQTVSRISRLFEAKERRQVHGIVAAVTVTEQRFAFSNTEAFGTLALISLSLAVVNLFPFLPLDGGHVFWAVAEKLRRRRIPFAVMERAGFVGFALVMVLFVIGLTNDISTLSGKGFGVPH